MSEFITIEEAIKELQAGRMIVLVDAQERENEGDLMFAADKVTPEAVNFMARYARGQICLALDEKIIDRLQIPLMPERNKLPNQARFTMSIEAATGVSTGVSAQDRSHTISVALNPKSTCNDISMPGHIFPLRARQGGILERAGHTEGSVDLARLAGLQSAAVICEIMNEDGTMARMPDLKLFAKEHKIKLVAINDLITYRLKTEMTIAEIASSPLPLKGTNKPFAISVFRDRYTQAEFVTLKSAGFNPAEPVAVRIHSECLTGDVLGSLLCDCGEQLQKAIQILDHTNGIILYMRQEGRGIGLANKIQAYALQAKGMDTVEANHHLGFQADQRSYGLCAQLIRYLGIAKVRLLTNNPHKIAELQRFGIEHIERVPLEVMPNKENTHYLKTKRDKLGHLLNLDI